MIKPPIIIDIPSAIRIKTESVDWSELEEMFNVRLIWGELSSTVEIQGIFREEAKKYFEERLNKLLASTTQTLEYKVPQGLYNYWARLVGDIQKQTD